LTGTTFFFKQKNRKKNKIEGKEEAKMHIGKAETERKKTIQLESVPVWNRLGI